MKVLACHLYNDFSGSPKVLKQSIKGWLLKNISITLFTNDNQGFLSDLSGVEHVTVGYRYRQTAIWRLLEFLVNQCQLFFKILVSANTKDIVYINTILPFGAALAGACKGAKVIYHVHETSITPVFLKRFLFYIANRFADEVIYVSNYLQQAESLPKPRLVTIPNCLEKEFVDRAKKNRRELESISVITIICSLKSYKGVFEFVALADTLPHLRFQMVLNAELNEINHFFSDTQLPDNMVVYPVQKDIHHVLGLTDLLVNLSRPKEWVETFGLTVIEAMAYGIPSIVPPVGGIAELVMNGYNGYKVDGTFTAEINQIIQDINNGNSLNKLSKNALIESNKYDEASFFQKSLQLITLKT